MLSKSFKRREFACKDGCGYDDISQELVEALQALRDYFDQPVTITSGCRCKEHNERVGGAKASKHMEGLAADFKVRGVSPNRVYEYLTTTYPNKWGIGNYPSWNHLDVRSDGIWRKEK